MWRHPLNWHYGRPNLAQTWKQMQTAALGFLAYHFQDENFLHESWLSVILEGSFFHA